MPARHPEPLYRDRSKSLNFTTIPLRRNERTAVNSSCGLDQFTSAVRVSSAVTATSLCSVCMEPLSPPPATADRNALISLDNAACARLVTVNAIERASGVDVSPQVPVKVGRRKH